MDDRLGESQSWLEAAVGPTDVTKEAYFLPETTQERERIWLSLLSQLLPG